MYNSAYLVNHKGREARYDKVRLAPFGEFIPWEPVFVFLGLKPLADELKVGDFHAGEDVKIFSLNDDRKFSTLICIEDMFPSLARRAVRRGAEFLVVITNDAWFSKSAAPYQHLQGSIFRAIENGVPVVRAANTGVSAFVSAGGEVVDRIQDSQGHDLFVMGGLVRSIEVGGKKTLYQRGGHWFGFFCLILMTAGGIVTQFKR